MTIEDGTHNGFRNVVRKFTSYTVQEPQSQKRKRYSTHCESLKSKGKVRSRIGLEGPDSGGGGGD
jgi:hypothetical protein